MMMDNNSKDIVLKGLIGGNLLAFLAAVGLFRMLDVVDDKNNWRIRWKLNGADWLPVLRGNITREPSQLIEILEPALKNEKICTILRKDIQKHKDTATIKAEEFCEIALKAQYASLGFLDRSYADFVVALGCESTHAREKEDFKIQDTAFRTMNGAGHQHFLKTMKDLAEQITHTQLQSAIFDVWSYRDEGLGLRWDPAEYRLHALRWLNPSGDKVKTVQGAARLAIEALPLFPTMPVGGHLETTGFSRRNSVTTFSWPIWETSIKMCTLRSLLALRDIQRPDGGGSSVHQRGIVEVYRSKRITEGKFRNFITAMPVLGG